MFDIQYIEFIILGGVLGILIFLYFKLGTLRKMFVYPINIIKACFCGGISKNADKLEKELKFYGYEYDKRQDIFFSHLDAWQRNFGYCRLYDEAMAPLGMIADCDPIYFDYDNKKWMIEFWKGQYDLSTGSEIGVYTSIFRDLRVPDLFEGVFYKCADNEDLLRMSFSLHKNGKLFFRRHDRHWWLTGFKLGEFSEPWELTMDINIMFKDEIMAGAFTEGLLKAGYADSEFKKNKKSVELFFDKTHTEQPLSRTELTDWLIQKKNKELCLKYQYITKDYDRLEDKIRAVKESDPRIFSKILNLGKNKKVFEAYDVIKKYLE